MPSSLSKTSFCCDVEQTPPRVLKSRLDLQISPDWHLTVKCININEPICILLEYIFCSVCSHACTLLFWLIIDELKIAMIPSTLGL